MAAPNSHRLQTFIGLSLLFVAVLGFILLLVLQLPKEDQVNQRAKRLQVIPRDFFSNNPTTEAIRRLNVPNGVPVNLDEANLGRSNVFESY